MRTGHITDTNFQGKLVITNRLTNKPSKCVDKVRSNIENLILKKDYNLYITQDYGKNEMRIIADYPFPLKPYQRKPFFARTQMNIPITSKASKYIDASSDVINKFENNMREKEQQAWLQEQQKQKIDDAKNILEYILLSPVFILDIVIHEINPKWGKKFEKLLEKIGI